MDDRDDFWGIHFSQLMMLVPPIIAK